jgi:adenylate cyclase
MSESERGPGLLDRPGRWPVLLERMVALAVLPGDRPDLVRTKRLFAAAMWASLVTSFVSAYQLYAFDAPWAAVAVCVPIVTATIALVAMWAQPNTYPAVMHVVALGTITTTVWMIILLGGVFESAGNTSWGVVVVVGAVAIFADRRAHFWLAVFAASTIGAFFVAQRLEPVYVLPNRGYFAVFNLLIITLFIYAMLYYFVRQSVRLYDESERLLRNILPDQVVERLKHSDEMIADEYESASILFADVAGFTSMAARLPAEEVINMLNEVFTAFDKMVTEHGLEKIKTIGDAYMVAAGVPVRRDDHAPAICDLALSMRDHVTSQDYAGHRLSMRIGIASGPVMAGIIGRQKFSYDLWGDTVNLASRMETTGTPERIHMTTATCELVSPWFICEERGVVEVKGKGPMQTWYLIGRRD